MSRSEGGEFTPETMAQMAHDKLYMARAGAPQAVQNMMSPYEHRAFTREATAENPLMAVPFAIATPAYQVYKAMAGARSEPSFEQIKQAYIGIMEGLMQGRGQ